MALRPGNSAKPRSRYAQPIIGTHEFLERPLLTADGWGVVVLECVVLIEVAGVDVEIDSVVV
jgi:hypothetical protein